MSDLIIYHEMLKIGKAFFPSNPQWAEIKDIMDNRLGEGECAIAPPPHPGDWNKLWSTPREKLLEMGLMVGSEGCGWELMLLPFEWGKELQQANLERPLFMLHGEIHNINRDPRRALFGMLPFGIVIGSSMLVHIQDLLQKQIKIISSICSSAGTDNFKTLRPLVMELGICGSVLDRLDKLHENMKK